MINGGETEVVACYCRMLVNRDAEGLRRIKCVAFLLTEKANQISGHKFIPGLNPVKSPQTRPHVVVIDFLAITL
jgi:hypothetical protein